jgi:hypothetical protein
VGKKYEKVKRRERKKGKSESRKRKKKKNGINKTIFLLLPASGSPI